MSPAQRLAEWLDADKCRSVDICFSPLAGVWWMCELEDHDYRRHCGGGEDRDAAITAALDAWQKGDG